MRRRDTDVEFGSLFDSDDDSLFGDRPAPGGRPADRPRPTRSDRHRQQRSRRRGPLILGLVGVLAVVVGLAFWLVVLPVYRHFNPSDYSGDGSGSVDITVASGDSASDIAATLLKRGVVASSAAFTDAANDNSQSQSIQPGTYRMHRQMSGDDALKLLLKPSVSQWVDNVIVYPGATMLDVATRLEAARCAPGTDPTKQVCGPGYSKADVQKAMADVSALGIPTDFLVNGKAPSSVEGFLYPGTYFFPEQSQGGSPTAALQAMIANFAESVRNTDFVDSAKANGRTPYQQLIAASIAQSEAKNPNDMPKVERVILNRIAKGMPLQSDATSAYAAKLQGLDPTKVIYDQLNSPFNSYQNSGLPPTPISIPGSDALAAAAHPAQGDWLYFVNSDANGDLFFTDSDTAFAQAAATCAQNNWGCG